MMTDDNNLAGSGSYVLNAMDENEREEFEAQLAASEDLRNEVTELTDTAVLLGMAVEPVTPSSALKQNIMARLGQTPQLAREEQVAPARTLRTVPPLADEPRSGGQPLRETNAKARQRWYARPVVAITAAAAAVVLIVGGVLTSNLALQGANTSQQADALATIQTASDVQRAEASVSTGGKATLVWSLSLRKAALIGKGLKALPGGETYELWYIGTKGAPRPAGLFQSNGKGTVQVLSGRMDEGDTVGITIEPAGGSKAPTTKPVLAIDSA
jgi:anti-sigma-K factor RskA